MKNAKSTNSKPNNVEAIYPLSPVQEGMLFHSQLEPTNGVYFAQFCFSLKGDLNHDAFQQSWQQVVDRHPVLRTLFVSDRTPPLQVVRRHATLPWASLDWRSDPGAQGAQLATFLEADRQAGFDLTKPPLMRFTLIQLADEAYQCIWSAHHLVLDGWSLPLLVQEVMSCYAARCRGEEIALPPVQPYRDYIKWIEKQDQHDAENFWRANLRGFTVPTPLVVDKTVPSEQGNSESNNAQSYTEKSIRLPRQIGTDLQSLARQNQLTLNTLLQGAWAMLLGRYSHTDDVIFGTVVSGRPAALPGVAGMVGPFINTLPLRVQLPSDAELIPWLQALQSQLAALRQVEHSPLVQVQQWSELPQGQPFFESVFALENYPADALGMGQLVGLEISELNSIEQNSYPLSLMVVPDEELWLRVLYDGSRFDPATIERLLGHYRMLLTGMIAQPNSRLMDLPILTQDEVQRLCLDGQDDDATTFPHYKPIQLLFEEQVAHRPNAVAASFNGKHLTYAELNAKANQLAHTLQARGVGPEIKVGIFMQRSLDMVVAILAALKAGGAYVPMDPVYPTERVAFMLEDSQAPVVITQQSLLDQLPNADHQIICVDQESDLIANEPTKNPAIQTVPANAAYVIYTSGSTGKPKGVLVSHANVARLLTATDKWFGFNEDDVWTLFHSYAFDFSIWEIWGALLYGGRLVVVPHEISRSPDAFYQLLTDEGVTVLNQTPSAFRQLIHAEERTIEDAQSCHPVILSSCHSLRYIIFGGEALDLQSLRPWFDRHGDQQPQLVNMYGITETTVHVTYRPLTMADLDRGSASLIGGPIPDLQLYLLDRDLRPVPIGVPGELYVGGSGVSRGYLGRPDLAAERFVPNPFSNKTGERLYKTGDLARYLPTHEDGVLELDYLGRIDHQVKIRGFRIELGEIEAELSSHPAVREAVVMTHAASADDVRLVAYLVPDPKQAGPVRELLRLTRAGQVNGHVQHELPNGMSVFYKNQSETDFMYDEIFSDLSYFKHGIQLDAGSCIFDVGANIGLFSLQVGQHCPNATIYAFEPVPPIFELLSLNSALYGLDAKLFNCGLSSSAHEDSFTYYPDVSVMSGRFADGAEERELVRSFLVSEEAEAIARNGDAQNDDSLLNEMLEQRLQSETITAQFRTISEIIAEEQIDHIDLLKVDVEKSELDVLQGVADADWSKIHQIVLEVHDAHGRLESITELLNEKGYTLTIEQESMLTNTELYSVYAIQNSRMDQNGAHTNGVHTNGVHTNGNGTLLDSSFPIWSSDDRLRRDVRAHIQQRLPEYMVPATYILLDALPLTPNGKIDRKALPLPDDAPSTVAESYVAPRTPTEDLLTSLWANVLNIDLQNGVQVGIHDDFFAQGGHSLLATQLVARIRKSFNVEFPLADLFAAPTIADLSAKIATQQDSVGAEAQSGPVPIAEQESYSLSFAQERLWILTQLEPDSPAYNIAAAVRLTGSLNRAALTESFRLIVTRHATLRTTFQTEQGQPVQLIEPDRAVDIRLVDLTHLSAEERTTHLQEQMTTEARAPFDLTHGPLLRLTLLRLDEQEHVLLIAMHHMVSDGWSMRILAEEFVTSYAALAAGQAPVLPYLPIQYADFAQWQLSWLQNRTLDTQLTYWRKQLAGIPTLLNLPTGRARPAVQTFNGAVHEFVIPAELTTNLRSLSHKEDVTLFMMLLTAWEILLHRYTGQDDFCVGTPIANRNRSEVEGLIGFFANTLVMRADLADNPTIRRVLARVRATAIAGYAHQDLPFEKLVSALQPDRNVSHSPLFQVMFAMQEAPMQQNKLADLILESSDLHNGTAKFDLTLFVTDEGNTLRGTLEYNTDLFDGTTIARMVGHLTTLLQGIIADPGQRIATLPMLSDAETQQLLVDWNGAASERPELMVHQMFEGQVERTPDHLAAVFGEQQLTYKELNARADQLAIFLQKEGAGPDTIVGIQMDRSIEMMVAILGILKAGAAYLPLDPKLPDERLSFIIEDANPAIVLTKEVVQSVPTNPVDPIPNPLSPVPNPQSLAYVIYTSGSTGIPKGTLITHGGLTNYLHWCLEAYPLTEGCGSLVHSTIAFDATVTGLFGPLLVGGAVHLLPETDDIEALSNAMRQRRGSQNEKFSLIKITPAHLELLNQLVPPNEANELTHAFVIGGENLLAEQIGFWQQNAPDTLLFNEYGPTETVVGCVVYEAAQWRGNGSVPIGQAIPNSPVYILDRHLNLVPLGVPGELYISGSGVARGYLNRAETTAERFVPDPFRGESGARMYRTGDLVFYRADGQMECLGRLDNQVKIRGYRVELGEIEAHLSQHPNVRENAVVIHQGANREKRIVAYYTMTQNQETLSATDLRHFLQKQLPGYMVPAFFIAMETMPLTNNGKIDRRALPAPDESRPELATEFILPMEGAEARLADIWQKALGLNEVGRHDNFFELGGDSIIAIQAITQANEAGLGLSPKQLFLHPTIAELATVVGTAKPIVAEQGVVTGPVPLTPIQHWFMNQQLAAPQHWNQSLLLELFEPFDLDLLPKVLDNLVCHHDALRLRFYAAETGHEQINMGLENATAPIAVKDLSHLSVVEQRATIEAISSLKQSLLDPTNGPLLRAVYFQCGGAQPDRLLFIAHHLVVDGVSWRILLADFLSVYAQLSNGQEPKLPRKSTSFQEWAQRLVDLAATTEIKADAEKWLSLPWDQVNSLPVDTPTGANNSAEETALTVSFSETETAQLLHEVPAAYRVEIADLLLAALGQTLHQWADQDHLLVDVEGHGRVDLFDDADLSRTVGWFTEIHPMILELDGAAETPGDLLKQVKEHRRNLPTQGISFGLLRYTSTAEQMAEFAALPQPEISFNYLGQFDNVLPDSAPIGLATDSIGPNRAPQNARPYLLDVLARVEHGQLRVEWLYSAEIYAESTIYKLALDFKHALQKLITYCLTTDDLAITATDVDEFGWDQDDLDDIMEEIE